MTGSIMQLATYGVENIYLTDKPQITFFKMVYKRYTNFSVDNIPQYFNSVANFNTKVSCILGKNGDLINNIYVVVSLPQIPILNNGIVVRWVEYLGYNLLKTIELEIGGKVIDTQYSEWLYIWNELNIKNNKAGLNNMIGNIDKLIKFENSKSSYILYIPLNFWFCRDIYNSLPIIALNNADIKINIEFEDINKCIITGPTHYIIITDAICIFKPYELLKINNSNKFIQFINFDNATLKLGYIKTDITISLNPNDILYGLESTYSTKVYDPTTNLYKLITTNNEILNFSKSNTLFRNIFNLSLLDAYLMVDYIYLENNERIKFINSPLTYLIDICQYDNDKLVFNINNKIKIGYSYPTKEILIRAQYTNINNIYYNNPFNFTTSLDNKNSKSLIKNLQIILNGFNRENNYDNNFYNYIQSYQHHNNVPPKGLFLYSFSINPFNIQPSGVCSFSKFDDISFDITLEKISYENQVKIRIYALSYNILKIENGICSLLFLH